MRYRLTNFGEKPRMSAGRRVAWGATLLLLVAVLGAGVWLVRDWVQASGAMHRAADDAQRMRESQERQQQYRRP